MKRIITLLLSILFMSCGSNVFLMKDQGSFKMTVVPVSWYIGFPTGTFKSNEQKTKPDSTSAYFLFSDSKQSDILPMVASFFIEPSKGCTNAKCLRDSAWSKLEPTLGEHQDVQVSEIGEAAVVEFTLPANYMQKNMYAHFYKDGYWIDVHLSKGFFDPESRAQFVDFVKSISFSSKTQM